VAAFFLDAVQVAAVLEIQATDPSLTLLSSDTRNPGVTGGIGLASGAE
jgi:hypothetical protein